MEPSEEYAKARTTFIRMANFSYEIAIRQLSEECPELELDEALNRFYKTWSRPAGFNPALRRFFGPVIGYEYVLNWEEVSIQISQKASAILSEYIRQNNQVDVYFSAFNSIDRFGNIFTSESSVEDGYYLIFNEIYDETSTT